MKKVWIALVAVLTCLVVSARDNKQVIAFNALPQAAQDVITANFPSDPVSYVTMEKELMDVDYEVRLQSGAELDFSKDGALESVDMKAQAVPNALVPEAIANYVTTTFPNTTIVKYSKDTRDQEVKLSNGAELEFDLNGNFLRID